MHDPDSGMAEAGVGGQASPVLGINEGPGNWSPEIPSACPGSRTRPSRRRRPLKRILFCEIGSHRSSDENKRASGSRTTGDRRESRVRREGVHAATVSGREERGRARLAPLHGTADAFAGSW
ncbi:hypothetical protein GCM10017562_75140 [Streptomyces roseofulvus]